MAGRIPQHFIDDLLARCDIVDIVGERVRLKKSGRNHSGLCPFHQEKTPSFTVSAERQFYHCFGCGAGGNALRFIMEYERLTFPEAVEQLAGRLGQEVPREGESDVSRERARQHAQKREEAVNLLERANRFYRQQLLTGDSEKAMAYLRRRGVSDDIAERYAIGFAPPGWDNLKQHLGSHGVEESVQVEYGLLVQKEETGRSWDRFRDRLMFPIRDWKGRTIAFGGRVLGDDKPKYLNSPESPVFHKGRELYGLYEARQAAGRPERLLIVEGYMDVVALAQFGINNAVATLGTATSQEHLKRLFRLVDEVVFCFDGDDAGRQAARRALDTVLPMMIDGRQARFLFLPEGEDPDSLVRSEGREGFENRVVCAGSLSEFMFEQAAQGRDLGRLEDRERFASAVLAHVARLPEGMLRSLMLRELSQRSGLEVVRLETLMNNSGNEVRQAAPIEDSAADHQVPTGSSWQARESRSSGRDNRLSLPDQALHLLVHAPGLVTRLPEGIDWCPEGDDGRLLAEVVQLLRSGGYRSPQVVLAHFHGTVEGERLLALMRRELLIPHDRREMELEGLVGRFRRDSSQRTPERELQALLDKEREGARLSDEEKQRFRALISELGGIGG
ncbi:DNA primase [Kushneria phosphatilytica]|uniref:DNA primase n=1 Tax=Kushneria phosphatilytica TaxID=657387 RepID=A0A1S1NXX7_9GAMM|nr:DNA primase [Kushneria phosphatilytica]OHV12747.1 DNA primase [Kushneria phosphatilytica]QEL10588.1 DNA primase [Kushneria phosphatilytica]